MFRDALLQAYHIHDNTHVITHHWSVYLSPFFGLVVLLFVIYVLRYIFNRFSDGEQIFTTIAGILGLVSYLKTLIDFFNLYLDAMVVADDGVTIYRRKSLIHYETEHFNRDKIEAMNHTQSSWADRLFNKGDLRVLLEHGTTYRFTNVDRPTHHSAVFLDHQRHYQAPDDPRDYRSDEHVDVLVEALGEVVREYMDEKSSHAPEEREPGRWK
jgi:hypothetical protein